MLPHHKWYLLPGNKEPHRAGKIIISIDNTMNIIVAIYIFWIMRRPAGGRDGGTMMYAETRKGAQTIGIW